MEQETSARRPSVNDVGGHSPCLLRVGRVDRLGESGRIGHELPDGLPERGEAPVANVLTQRCSCRDVGVKIRPFGQRDRAFIAALFEDYLTEERVRSPGLALPPDFASRYLPKLVEDAETKGGTILIAESNGEQAGFVAALPQERPSPWDETAGKSCIVMELHVAARFRRQGIGRRLLREAESRFTDLGFDWITLGVFAANAGAQQVYALSGYRHTYSFMGKALGADRPSRSS